MHVLVIGASGGTGRRVVDRLVVDGHRVRAMVRRPDQAAELTAAGARTVTGDLEGEMDHAVEGVEAVLFCAGSGAKTGPDATLRVDLHGAVRTIDACVAHGVSRFVMLSSMAADDPLRGSPAIRHYLAAKHAADRILLTSGLAATVVRPGELTDDPATGLIELGVPTLGHRGTIPRADVAAVMAACLREPATVGATFEILAGQRPISDALRAL